MKKFLSGLLKRLLFIIIISSIYGIILKTALESPRITDFVNQTFQFLIERIER